METILAIGIVVALIGSVALLTWAISQFMCWNYDRIQKKRKKAHPYLWQLFDEVSEKSKQSCLQYNHNVAPLKKQIQAILDKMDYWPAEIREAKEQEAEQLRLKLYPQELEYEVLNTELKEIRREIHNYVNKHDLTWAKSWGW